MNYVLEPSLEHILLVKVAATLWNQDDVKTLLTKFHIPLHYVDSVSGWEKIEAVAIKKVAKLPLPKQMKEQILCFIRPVGFEIYEWRKFHDFCEVRVELPNEFCWTPQGTIDRKKTAKMMIKDESLYATTRYKLACIYCLEDDIPKLWDEISEGHRTYFFSPIEVNVILMVEFWTYYMKGDLDKINTMIESRMDRMCSPYQFAFELAISDGNRVAVEYFLQKLTAAEKDESMAKIQENIPSDVLCFLLSQLDEQQQLEVFKKKSFKILKNLLDWPLQSFFMETTNQMWDVLSEQDYVVLLNKITYKIKNGYKDFNYQKLFGEFWKQSPHAYKRLHLNEIMFYSTISNLFEIRDEENIRLIFQDTTLESKKELFYHCCTDDICMNLMNGKNESSLLKYFIKECLPSKDEVIEFKEKLRGGEVWSGEIQNDLKFIHILDEVICEFKKRKCEEGDTSKAKKM